MNEVLRLEAVGALGQLRLEDDKELHDALLIAKSIFDAPIAALSLLDEDKHTIKLNIGLSNKTYPKVISLCNYTSAHKEIFVVEDSHDHEYFATKSRLPDENTIRFYAGYPLITKEGLCIGTLCVIDHVPHNRSIKDELSFSILAKHVISIMEAKLNLSRLDRSFAELEQARAKAISNEIKLRALFESLTDVYVFLGMSGEILDFNQAAYDYILKFKGKRMVRGGYTADYLNEVDNAAFMANFRSAQNGERVSQEMLSNPEVAERIWWDSIFEPVHNKDGQMMGVSYIARNINKRKMDSEKILKQNKILKKIAHIHAHDYRAPVCAILGIMNLIEGDGYTASKDYLLMLQKAVKKLDEKTQSVISLISDLSMISDAEEAR
jgi:PAS domain S-box-containing protein